MLRTFVFVSTLLAFVAAPGSAFAQAEVLMMALCKKITDDPARLKCFDAIGAATKAGDETGPPVVKEWKVEEKKSPIDDSPEISAILPSEDGESYLVIRCKEHKTEAILAPKGLFASETGIVLLRLNDLPPASATWAASTNNRSLFAPNGQNFVKMLPDDGVLFVRATGWQNKRASDATFKLATVSGIRAKISAACRWDAVKPTQAAAPKPPVASDTIPKPNAPVSLQPAR